MYVKQYAYALAHKNVFLCAYFSTKKDTFVFNPNCMKNYPLKYPFLIEFCKITARL